MKKCNSCIFYSMICIEHDCLAYVDMSLKDCSEYEKCDNARNHDGAISIVEDNL